MTVRQQIILLLEESPLGFRELSKRFRLNDRDLADHLSHITRTMKYQKKRLIAHPFHCMGCGFIFKDRKHFGKPGRCPRCRSTHIEDPVYTIEK